MDGTIDASTEVMEMEEWHPLLVWWPDDVEDVCRRYRERKFSGTGRLLVVLGRAVADGTISLS